MFSAGELTSDENMAKASFDNFPKCMEGSFKAPPQKKKEKEGPAVGSSSGEPTSKVAPPAVGPSSREQAVNITPVVRPGQMERPAGVSSPAIRSSPVAPPIITVSPPSIPSLADLAPTTSFLAKARMVKAEEERKDKEAKAAKKKARHVEKKRHRHRMAPKDLSEDDRDMPTPTSPAQPVCKKQKGVVIYDVNVAVSTLTNEAAELTSSGEMEQAREVPFIRADPRIFRRAPDQAIGALPHETEVELTRIGKVPLPVVGEERVIVDESLLAPLEGGMPHFPIFREAQGDSGQGNTFSTLIFSSSPCSLI